MIRQALFTALAAELKAAMMPSPVCLTSRPLCSPSAARTMLSWTPSMTMAASSPWREHISVEPTMSVNMIDADAVVVFALLALDDDGAGVVDRAVAHEAVDHVGIDLDEFLGGEAVGFAGGRAGRPRHWAPRPGRRTSPPPG